MTATQAIRGQTTICRNGETWLFRYGLDRASLATLARTVGAMASDPKSNFEWYAAALVMADARKAAIAARGL